MFEQSSGDIDARSLQPICKLWADSRGGKRSKYTAILGDTLLFKKEDVLHAHRVFFHTSDFRQMRHTPAAVAHASYLNDNGDCGGNLAAYGFFRKIQVGHESHGFHTCNSIAGAIGVDGRQRTIVASIHRLQHIERFFDTHLTNDDTIRPHTQTVDEELPLLNGTCSFHVGRATLHAHHVALLHNQLG